MGNQRTTMSNKSICNPSKPKSVRLSLYLKPKKLLTTGPIRKWSYLGLKYLLGDKSQPFIKKTLPSRKKSWR